MTNRDVLAMVEKSQGAIAAKIDEFMQTVTDKIVSQTSYKKTSAPFEDEDEENPVPASSSSLKVKEFRWTSGQMKPFPENWNFVACNPPTLWRQWFVGIPSLSIRPFRFLNQSHFRGRCNAEKKREAREINLFTKATGVQRKLFIKEAFMLFKEQGGFPLKSRDNTVCICM